MARGDRRGWLGGFAVGAIACAAIPLAAVPALGETLESALAQAYQSNPTLNAQRAAVRAIDENVPQALSGYRPRVAITASGGQASLSSTTRTAAVPATTVTQSGYNTSLATGVTATQTLFNGFQTSNRTRQAEAQVLSARVKCCVRASSRRCSTLPAPT